MLKVLVAPYKAHDLPETDATDRRELVSFAGLCDARSHTRCGCSNSFLVLRTRIGVAAAEVAERDMTLDEYINAFIASYVMAGLPDDADTLRTASSEALQMNRLAKRWPVGTVLNVRGDNVFAQHPQR